MWTSWGKGPQGVSCTLRRRPPDVARILVKTNIADVLRTELARPRWMGEQVALGTATDCYQPIEGKYCLTRRALEVLLAHRNPVQDSA